MRTPPEQIDAGAVVLRRWQPGWEAALTEAVRASLPELRAFMGWAQGGYGPDDARRFLTQARRDWNEGQQFDYAIQTPAGDLAGDLAGAASLMTRMGPGVLEIGYWTRTAYAGRGFATAAARALADAALRVDGVHTVALRHDAANHASARVAAKAGFVEVQRRRSTLEPAQQRTDVEVVWQRGRSRPEMRPAEAAYALRASSASPGQRLIQVGEQVVDALDADR